MVNKEYIVKIVVPEEIWNLMIEDISTSFFRNLDDFMSGMFLKTFCDYLIDSNRFEEFLNQNPDFQDYMVNRFPIPEDG